MQKINEFSEILHDHQALRNKSINLLPSENVLSPMASSALANDMAGRYSSDFYGGTKFIRKVIDLTQEYAKEVFRSEYASIIPISGHLCDLAALYAYTKPAEEIALISKDGGGYPFDIGAFGRKIVPLPFDHDNWTIDYDKIPNFYEKNHPTLTILGSSVIPYPTDISKFEPYNNQRIVFDGSHVLGLIAGDKFQNPLKEGASVLFGSTHKSFPGPQGGIILANEKEAFEKIASQFAIQSSNNPFDHMGTILVDNVHANRIAALGVTLLEMLKFGSEYATQIVKNSQILGQELKKYGLPVVEHRKYGVSQSHQLLLPMEEGERVKESLEKNGLMVDAFIRIGTAEVTRRGMKEEEMKQIADLMHQVIHEKTDVSADVRELAGKFTEIHYTFSR